MNRDDGRGDGAAFPLEDPEEQGAVTIRFLGAARTTTGSLHRIRTPAGDLLLDCGTFQGGDRGARGRDLPIDPRRVRSVVISHAHIDHCGALPTLVRMGYHHPIHATEATADMLRVMLEDAAKIQEYDARRANEGRPPEERVDPVFTAEDVARTLRLVRAHRYGEEFDVLRGTRVRLVDAGHILGSAAVHVTVTCDEGTTTIGFTGDLGRSGMPILKDPVPLPETDWYITESTYGKRDHDPAQNVQEELGRIVRRAADRGGKLLVPSFALGRTQVLLYMLHRLRENDAIPDVPIYVDSPMAKAATEVFERHRDAYDRRAKDFHEEQGSLFEAPRTSFVEDVGESKALNRLEGPAVIVSSSGMLEGGRILHHLRSHGGDDRNVLCFVGYQARNTLGRRILDGARDVTLFGEPFHVAADVTQIEGLSAHADRGELLAYLKKLPRPPRRTFLVHGEEDEVEALGAYFRENGFDDVRAPVPGEWHRLL